MNKEGRKEGKQEKTSRERGALPLGAFSWFPSFLPSSFIKSIPPTQPRVLPGLL
jgi:hypothetical protein